LPTLSVIKTPLTLHRKTKPIQWRDALKFAAQ
jgi:hypothetical protein